MLLEKLQPLQLPIGALNYFARARCSAWQAPRLSFGREWPSEFCSWPVSTFAAMQRFGRDRRHRGHAGRIETSKMTRQRHSALYEVVAQSQPEPLLAAALLPIIFNAQSVA